MDHLIKLLLIWPLDFFLFFKWYKINWMKWLKMVSSSLLLQEIEMLMSVLQQMILPLMMNLFLLVLLRCVEVNDYFVIDLKRPSYTITRSYFSDYGECIDIYAPGTIYLRNLDNKTYDSISRTSFSSPIVVGVAATIISDHPEIKYDFHLMKQTLIDLSLKDVIWRFNRWYTQSIT